MRTCRLVVLLLLCPITIAAQGLTTSKIDEVLGRTGQKSGEVYRVAFPRTDLHVIAEGVAIKPGLALGSWAAFVGTDEHASVMGDLVLLPDEVAGVMRKLRSAGFEISAVHNHLDQERPHVMYMHYMGRGDVADLAKSLESALAESKTPLGPPAPSSAAESTPAWVQTIDATLGAQGKWAGGVLSFAIPRAEPILVDGMALSGAQGVAESINFQEAVQEKLRGRATLC
jgi:hypothetical protein